MSRLRSHFLVDCQYVKLLLHAHHLTVQELPVDEFVAEVPRPASRRPIWPDQKRPIELDSRDKPSAIRRGVKKTFMATPLTWEAGLALFQKLSITLVIFG